MSLLAGLASYLILLLLPGFGLAAVFLKKEQRSWWGRALFSFVLVPPILFLVSTIFPLRTGLHLGLAMIFISILGYFLGTKIPEEKKLTFPVPSLSSKQTVIFILLTSLLIFMTLYPRLGLLNRTFLPGSGDEPKHLEIVTAIASLGLPPQNHARPTEELTYYFYDYVYPGILVIIFPYISPMQAWLIHLLVQTVLQSVLFLEIAFLFLRKEKLTLTAFFVISFVGGFDFFVSQNRGIGIEYWMDTLPMTVRNLQISLPSTLLLFVPQHLFSAVLSFVPIIILYLAKGNAKIKGILAGMIIGSMLGFSVFVFIGWLVAFTAYCLANSRKFKELFITLSFPIIISLIVSLPMLPLYFSGPNFFRLREATYFPFAHLPVPILIFACYILFLTIEMNLIPLFSYGSIYFLFKKNREFSKSKLFLYLLCQGLVFPLLIFVIYTLGNNDFALRGMIPAQIAMILLFTLTVDEILKKVRGKTGTIFVGFIIVLLSLGFFSSIYAWNEVKRQPIPIDKIYQDLTAVLPQNSIIFYNGNLTGLDRNNIVDFSIPAFSNRLIFVAGGQFSLRGGYETLYLKNKNLISILPEGEWYTYQNATSFCQFLKTPLSDLSVFTLISPSKPEGFADFATKRLENYYLTIMPVEKIKTKCQ